MHLSGGCMDGSAPATAANPGAAVQAGIDPGRSPCHPVPVCHLRTVGHTPSGWLTRARYGLLQGWRVVARLIAKRD